MLGRFGPLIGSDRVRALRVPAYSRCAGAAQRPRRQWRRGRSRLPGPRRRASPPAAGHSPARDARRSRRRPPSRHRGLGRQFPMGGDRNDPFSCRSPGWSDPVSAEVLFPPTTAPDGRSIPGSAGQPSRMRLSLRKV
ncbi:hypothetical protein TSO352_12150 [Azospirillum sp. TSO35-2]|nr:hypothetical protein TSO352_12150 [Azospirillum sp. TSO35-2]